MSFDLRQLAPAEQLNGSRVRPTGEQLRPADPGRSGTVDRYLDPVPGYEGRWLAGMAPVGDTGFIVVVQTRYEVVLEPIWRAVQRVALPLLVALLLGWAALWLVQRQGRR